MKNGPKVLLLDIETSPIISYTWGLFDQNVGLNQIVEDWHLLAFAAKWLGSKKVIYADQSKEKDVRNDKKLAKQVWDLLDECDIIITQNGKKFDVKKLNARFLEHGFQPPSSYKHIDIYQIVKNKFGFTSNKLAYLTGKFCKRKKLSHNKFPGFELWRQCLAGNKKAWKEMEKYNKMDVISLEELYHKVIPWDSSINFNLYTDNNEHVCKCGSVDMVKRGFAYTARGKYRRYKCSKCGAEVRDTKNLFKVDKKRHVRIK